HVRSRFAAEGRGTRITALERSQLTVACLAHVRLCALWIGTYLGLIARIEREGGSKMDGAYSHDLRDRVLADRDRCMPTQQVAELLCVSASWVRRVMLCRREHGEVAPP